MDQVIDEDDEFSILFDFDAEKSVKRAGNSDKYILIPVIKAILSDGTEIEGEDDGEEGEDDGEEGDDDGEEGDDDGEEGDDDGEEG